VKELTLKVLPCYLGAYPAWIEISDATTILIKQPIGDVVSARTPQQLSQLTSTYTPSCVSTGIIPAHAAMYAAVDSLLDSYKFLTVWKELLLHHNLNNDLLFTIITERDSKSLCIPFEALTAMALRERGKPDRSEIPQLIGSNPSIIFRRKWGDLNIGLGTKMQIENVYYYSGTLCAAGHEAAIQAICTKYTVNFTNITDMFQIQQDRPWLLYFIGHGGANGLWNESDPSTNLLADIERLDLAQCKGVILNCCRTSSYLHRDEIMTPIFTWLIKPAHIFANPFSVQPNIAMERGIGLLQNLLSNMDIHDALSNCIMSCPGIDDQKLSFYWFDCI